MDSAERLFATKGFNGTWRQLSPIKKLDAYYGSLE